MTAKAADDSSNLKAQRDIAAKNTAADGWAGPPIPTILIRTPYNRRHTAFFAERFAERGYYVLVQDIRGTCESEGENDPLELEEEDGQDTLKSIYTRLWFQQCPKVLSFICRKIGKRCLGCRKQALRTEKHVRDCNNREKENT